MCTNPGFTSATNRQVGSAQGTRSLEQAAAGLRTTLHASIEAIPREVWESMLGGDPENYDFCRAVEPTPPPGFTLAAISVSEAERILAVAPIFYVDYRLDTPWNIAFIRRATEREAHMVKFVMFVLSHLGKPNLTLVHARQPGMRALSPMEEEQLMEEYRAVSDAPRYLRRRLRMHVRVPTTTPRAVARPSQKKVEPHGMPPAAIKRRRSGNRIIAR
jgi:hypothetical protein